MSDPEIIREDAPHQVTMSDNSNVAVRKTGDPAAASVRKVLAEAEPEPTVQDASIAVHRELAPETPAASGVHRELAPEVPAQSGVHRELVPEGLSGSSVHRELVPEALVASKPEGMTVPPALVQDSSDVSVPGSLGTDQTSVVVPASAATERPTLEIPVGQATARPVLELQPGAPAVQPAPDEAAVVKALLADLKDQKVEQLEEQLGGPEAVWVEMDFPARVVKLKIENDKVRQKLDVLERSAGTPR